MFLQVSIQNCSGNSLGTRPRISWFIRLNASQNWTEIGREEGAKGESLEYSIQEMSVGTYQVRANSSDAPGKASADFIIEVTRTLLPTVRLVAPLRASSKCDFSLRAEAVQPSRPSNELRFSWQCFDTKGKQLLTAGSIE